jgi:hypothetical protein
VDVAEAAAHAIWLPAERAATALPRRTSPTRTHTPRRTPTDSTMNRAAVATSRPAVATSRPAAATSRPAAATSRPAVATSQPGRQPPRWRDRTERGPSTVRPWSAPPSLAVAPRRKRPPRRKARAGRASRIILPAPTPSPRPTPRGRRPSVRANPTSYGRPRLRKRRLMTADATRTADVIESRLRSEGDLRRGPAARAAGRVKRLR